MIAFPPLVGRFGVDAVVEGNETLLLVLFLENDLVIPRNGNWASGGDDGGRGSRFVFVCVVRGKGGGDMEMMDFNEGDILWFDTNL